MTYLECCLSILVKDVKLGLLGLVARKEEALKVGNSHVLISDIYDWAENSNVFDTAIVSMSD